MAILKRQPAASEWSVGRCPKPPASALNAYADDAHPENAHGYASSPHVHAHGYEAPSSPTQTHAHVDDAHQAHANAHVALPHADAHGHAAPSGAATRPRPSAPRQSRRPRPPIRQIPATPLQHRKREKGTDLCILWPAQRCVL